MEGFRVTRHGMEFYYKDNRHCEAAGTKETTRKVSVKSAEQYMFDRKDTNRRKNSRGDKEMALDDGGTFKIALSLNLKNSKILPTRCYKRLIEYMEVWLQRMLM